MKTRKPGRKALIVILLAIFAIMSVACAQGASTEEVQEAVQTGVQQALATQSAQPAEEQAPINVQVEVVMPTPAPTSTPAPTKTPAPEPTATLAPTSTPMPEEALAPVASSNVITHTMNDGVPGWSITGAPATISVDDLVDMSESKLVSWEEMPNRPLEGDLHWTNIAGGEWFTGDPGTYLTHNEDDASKNDSALLITPMTWNDFDSDVEKSPIWEGANSWVNACGATIQIIRQIEGVDHVIAEINVECAPYHAWFVVVKGLRRDYSTPGDLNLQMVITNANSPFGHAQHFPPGDDLSAIYLTSNILSGFERMSSGADGYLSASVLFYDAETGYFSVTHIGGASEEFVPVATNLTD